MCKQIINIYTLLFGSVSVPVNNKGTDSMYCVFGSDGTTDVTRTMHFGTPSAYEKVHLFICCFHFEVKSNLKFSLLTKS